MNFYFQAAQKTIDKKNQCDIFNAMKELNARQKKDGMDMTTGEPFKLLVIYSFPILLGSLFQQLYNMCDTIIVGRLLGPNALAAVGNTGPMNFLVLGFLNGMTSGFAVITAQRFGAQDSHGLRRSVAMNVILNIASGVVITLLACAFTMPILKATNTPQEIIQESFDYIFVIYLGIMSMVLYNGCSCVLRAVGDSKTPLYFLVASSVLNIIFDILFIAQFKMGVAGAALATVIAQALAGIASFVWILIRYPELHLSREDFSWNSKFALKHLNIGMNMGFQFSITAIGVVILQGALNNFGPTKIAAFTAAQKVEQLVTVAAGVMGITMTNFAGQNLGAAKIDRIKEGVTKSIVISVAFAIIAAILACALSDQMTALFLDRASMDEARWNEILDASRTYLRICSIFFPILFVLFIYRNTLQGVGRGFWPLMGGVFELVARTVAAYTLPAVMGFAGICTAEPLAWIAATVPLGIAYYIIMSKFRITNKAE